MYEVVLFANVLLWLTVTVYYARLPVASAFHPVGFYLFFHGFVFSFRPIIVHLQGYTALYNGYGFAPTVADKTTVILATMLGLVFFVAMALRSGAVEPRFNHDRCTEIERRELIKPFLFVTALLGPLGVVSILANWVTRSNDSTSMVLDAATGRFLNTTGTAYFDDLQLFLAPLTVVYVWLYRFRWWTFIPLAAFIVLRGGTGGRWPILMACTSVALLFLFEQRKKLPNFKSAVLVVAALWLFQVVGADRGANIRKLFMEDNSLSELNYGRYELGFLESMDFANLEYFEYIVYAVPQRSGTYGYFLDNLQIFTEPVPRAIWAAKPVGPPIQLFNLFDYGFPIGMTYSLPGEGWMQAGYLGVAIWCGLFGWIFGSVYAGFQRTNQSTLKTLAYLLFLPLSLQFFRDGLLLTLIKTLAWFLLPILMIYGFARLAGVPLVDDLRLRALSVLARKRSGVPLQPLPRRRVRSRNGHSPAGEPAE